MANSGKVLQVRLQEKIDTLANWLALDTDTTPFKPLAGEKINVKVPTANSEADGESVGYEIITKTGDGSTRFKDLPWDSALAADVYDWAKAAVKPSYSIGEITDRKELSISGAGTKVVSYDGDTADSLNIVGEGLITVTPDATNNKITIKTTANNYSLPAAGSSLGGVKTGGVATISNGQITAISKAANATTADTATETTGTLTIQGNGTPAVAFKGADKTLNIKGNGLISVSGEDGAITISTTANNYSLPAAGTSLGGVKTGGVATISNGQITAISEASHAANASSADTAAVCTGNAATATTATTANKTKGTLTLKAGTNSKTFNGSGDVTFEVTAANLGISAPLDFVGTTTTALTDGATTNPITVNSASYTAVKGDVVLYGDKEFLFTGSAWEELGDASALADAVATLGAKQVIAGNGLTGTGAISTSPTLNVGAGVGIAVATDAVKAKLRSETALTVDSAAATTTSGRVYPVAVDKTGYLAVNVPWTDTKVTSAANHYTPATDTNSALNAEATSTTAATWGSTDMVTGVHLQRDSKGHVTGMTVDSVQMPSNPNTDKTKVTAGIGLAGGGSENSSTGVTVKAKLRSETALANDSAAATETAGRIYPVATDNSGYLAVNVPWNDTTYNNATTAAAGLMSADDKAKLDGIAAQANKYSLPLAASGTRGGIKIGYSASGANIPVQLSSEKAYVALTKTAVTSALGYTPPTTNTEYSLFTTTANGLTSKGGNANNVLFGDNTWAGATDYIILCGGSASVNV